MEMCCTGRIMRAFKGLGSNLNEFLSTLDGVHDVLKHQQQQNVEEDQEAAFICTTHEGRLQLDFSTDRPAVAYLLVGSLKAIARILYLTEIDIDIIQSEEDARCFKYVTFNVKSFSFSVVLLTLYFLCFYIYFNYRCMTTVFTFCTINIIKSLCKYYIT